MDGKGDVSSVDPPSILPSFPLLMASPSVTSASLMIDLKGDEKTPHLHLTPSSFREGDIYIFDPFRDGSPSPSNEQKSRRSRSGKDNGKSGKVKMRYWVFESFEGNAAQE